MTDFHHGLLGEMRRVHWSDFDFRERSLTLRADVTKTGTLRVIPITRELAADIQELRRTHDELLDREPDYVFVSPDGRPWPESSAHALKLLNRLLVRAGIEKFNAAGESVDVHSLRHTAGSRLARRGVSLALTQKLLGHSTPTLTMKHYVHLGLDDLREAVEMVAAPMPRIVRTADREAIA